MKLKTLQVPTYVQFGQDSQMRFAPPEYDLTLEVGLVGERFRIRRVRDGLTRFVPAGEHCWYDEAEPEVEEAPRRGRSKAEEAPRGVPFPSMTPAGAR